MHTAAVKEEQASKIQQVFQKFQAVNPKPDYLPIEKIYTTPFMSLVGVVLSAQTRDEKTAEACARLFAVATTPEEILALDDEVLRSLIRPVGMYNTKTKNLKTMSRQLLDRHNGQVPSAREDLLALTGVGRKSTDIMMRFVFQQPAIAVDTHVHRLANRLGVAATKTEEQTANVLDRDTPDEFRWSAHEWMVEFGKHVCKARNPLCSSCMFTEICDHYKDTVGRHK